jgi:hypothetical protein
MGEKKRKKKKNPPNKLTSICGVDLNVTLAKFSEALPQKITESPISCTNLHYFEFFLCVIGYMRIAVEE